MGKYIILTDCSFASNLGSIAGSTPPVTPVSLITITNKSSVDGQELTVGARVQLGVTVSPSNASDKRISYSSSNTSVATVSGNGLVSVVGAGSCVITVSSVASPSVKDTASFTAVAGAVVMPTSVSVTNKAALAGDHAVGGTAQLSVTVSPSNTTNKAVAYSSSDTSVARVSVSGLVTFVSAGSCVITVRSSANESLYDSVSLTVSGQVAPGGTWKAILQPFRSDDWSNQQKVQSPSNGCWVNVNTTSSDYTSSLVDIDNNEVGVRMARAEIAGVTGKTYVNVVKFYNSGLDDSGGAYYAATLANLPYVYKNVSTINASIGYFMYGATKEENSFSVAAVKNLPNGRYILRFFAHTSNLDHARVWANNATCVNGVPVTLLFKNGESISTSTQFCEDIEITITDGLLYIENASTATTISAYNLVELEYMGS